MTRPASIIRFEQFYLGALALGLLNSLFSWSDSVAMMEMDPNSAMLGDPTTFLVLTMGIGLGINLLLWFFIARKASNVAKWIWLVLLGLGIIGMLMTFNGPLAPAGMTLALGFVALFLQIAAAWFLFRPDAMSWFRKEQPADISRTFD